MKSQNQKRIRFKNAKGFTLIEMIIALTVFVIAITSIVTIFLRVTSTGRSLRELEELQQNGRQVMDFIAREVRKTAPTFDASGFPQHVLTLGANTLQVTNGVLVYAPGTGYPINLTTDKINVEKFDVYYNNPGSTEQSWVMVYVSFASKADPEIRYDLQTIVSTRQY